MKKKGKRGLSTVIITLIIILVSLVAIALIWVAVRNVIQKGSENVQMGQFTMDASVEVIGINETRNNVSLIITRNPGKGDFTGVVFLFENATSKETVTRHFILYELESRGFELHLEQLNVSNLTKLSIFPLYKSSSNEFTMGSKTDKYIFSGIERFLFRPGGGAICGNNIREMWEACDGTDWGGVTDCTDLGFTSGTLTCDPPGDMRECRFNLLQCQNATCTPNCAGKECGSDGCSGSCGDCSSYGAGYTCNATGRCVSGGDSSLVAYYPFNGNANDESGNGHNGVLVNSPVFVTGKIGQGLKFNGVQSVNGMYVTVPDSNSLEGFTALTLCAWVNVTSIYATDGNIIIAKATQTAGASAFDPFSLYEFSLTPSGNYAFGISTGVSGSRKIVTSASTVSLNIWHHLCGVYNGTTMSLYKNGIKDTNTVLTNLVVGSNSIDVRIGAFMAALPYTDIFDGTIDEVRIYNRSLSQTEITSLAGIISVQCNDGIDNDANGCSDYPIDTGCSSASDTSESGGTCLDVTPPTRSNGAPTGTLPQGTTQTTISLNTNENAICRYSTTYGTAYSSMTNTFITTGGTSHSSLITGLTNGTAYNYYVRCNDTAGNFNTNDYAISFSVGSPAPPSEEEPTNCSITTCYYVLQGASGTGTSWNNAYGTIPSTLQRGAVYFLADGSYGSYTFNTAVSGTQLITIKKAISTDHGTDIGWQSSYGDQQAIFNYWRFDTAYWMVDGVTGGGPGSWESGFGFRVINDQPNIYDYHIRFQTNNADNIIIRHTDVGPATIDSPGCDSLVYTVSTPDSITFQYSYFHDAGDVGLTIAGGTHYNWLIEYSRFERLGTPGPTPTTCNAAGGDNHGAGVELYDFDGLTIRYSSFSDSAATGWIGYYGSGGLMNWFIYGNIFYSNLGWNYGWGNGIIYQTSGSSRNVGNVRIYDNTFYRLYSEDGYNVPVIGLYSNDVGPFEFRNNLIFLNGYTGGYSFASSSPVVSHNAGDKPLGGDPNFQTLTVDPLIDGLNGNFHLNAPTQAGVSLSYPYDTDMDGNTRGADGTWDRGAYEYV